ncbi:MAG: methionine gamma-lyase family protein, partial [Bacillota bacterium]
MQQQMEYWLGKASEGETCLAERFAEIDQIALSNQKKVLESFWREQVADFHLHGSTGYGYGDEGRDTLDRVYARVFNAPRALVRAQFVSGTHAIGAAIYGAVAPGDEILSITGRPYDTLEQLLGIKGSAPGNLRSLGVSYRQVELTRAGEIDLHAVKTAIHQRTKLVMIQRSRGYSWRPSQTIDQIGQAIQVIREVRPDLLVFVDNCYGELAEMREPTDVGADLVAGSLIKNLGGGLAPSGGYIVGRDDLVEAAASRLTMPGLGSHMGASLGDSQRLMFQGLFLAPHVVGQAIKGMH